MAAQTDPTVMIGGTLPLLHSGYRVTVPFPVARSSWASP